MLLEHTLLDIRPYCEPTYDEGTSPNESSVIKRNHHNVENSANFLPRTTFMNLYLEISTNSGLDLLSLFLQYDPINRISARNSLEHDYFRGLQESANTSMRGSSMQQ